MAEGKKRGTVSRLLEFAGERRSLTIAAAFSQPLQWR